MAMAHGFSQNYRRPNAVFKRDTLTCPRSQHSTRLIVRSPLLLPWLCTRNTVHPYREKPLHWAIKGRSPARAPSELRRCLTKGYSRWTCIPKARWLDASHRLLCSCRADTLLDRIYQRDCINTTVTAHIVDVCRQTDRCVIPVRSDFDIWCIFATALNNFG